MADLKISALNSLAGADLVAADVVAVVDDSASETKKLTVSDLIANGVTLISNSTIPSAKILFSAGAIDTAELAASAVETAKINDSAVTAAKLADNSSVTLVSSLPASGDFTGQIALDTTNDKIYIWDGSAWDSVKGAGSINVVNGSTSGIVNITATTSGDTVTVSTTLDDTSAAANFLAGPTGAGGTVGYRAIAGSDLPVATSSTKGAVQVNGNGLTMSNDEIQINNSVTAETTNHHVVQYDANGLITAGRVIAGSDIPAATSSVRGSVFPGTGLAVTAAGELNHSNNITAGTFTKVTVDAEGHVSATATLAASDIPDLGADKITTGTLPTARIANDAVTADKLANESTTKFIGAGSTSNVVTFPTGDFKGQFAYDEKNEDLYVYTGNSFIPITVISGNLVNAGTYNASTNLITSVTTAGSAAGFTSGGSLPTPATTNLNYYVVVDTSGTGSGAAPGVALAPPDMLVSLGTGSTFELVDVSNAIAGQTAANISVVPVGSVAATDVQAAIQEIDSEKLAKAGGTMTGNLELGDGIVIVFEGATANDYETTLTVVDPTADRTITLPNETGTVVTTGSSGVVTSTMITDGTIVNADISASAEIAVSKLANGTARQLLQTDSTGADVEFTSNIDVPGTLDCTGAGTFDSTLTVTGVINADGKVKFPAGTAALPSFYNGTDTDTGLYFSAANEISVSTAGTQRVVVNSSGSVGIGDSAPDVQFNVKGSGTSFAGLNVHAKLEDTTALAANNGGMLAFEGVHTSGGSPAAYAAIHGGKENGTDGNYAGYLRLFTRTNGSLPAERVRIDSSGNLGIGTTSPASKAHVKGGSLTIEHNSPSTGTGQFNINSESNSQVSLSYDDQGHISIGTASAPSGQTGFSEKIRIDSSGNVGINTTSADGTLHVHTATAGSVSANASADNLIVENSGAGGISILTPNASAGALFFGSPGDNIGAALRWNYDNNEFQIGPDKSGAHLRLNSGDGVEAMRIDSSGRLLVGTSSSSATASAVFEGNSGSGSSSGQICLARGQASPSDGSALGQINFADNTHATAGYIIGQRDGGTWSGSSLPSRINFGTTADGASSPTERMRIDSSGRVLVGSGAVATPLADDGGLDISSNNHAILIGGSGSGARANSSTKDGKIGAAHYTNTEEPVVIVRAVSNSTENNLHWGGFTGTSNAATSHKFYTAANNTTTSGTERMQIASNGVVTVKNGAIAEIDALTDAATITPDLATSCNFSVTLAGNRTLANPSNITAGQSGSIFVSQDGTGSRTLAFGSYWDFAGGTAPTLTTTASAVDRIDYIVRSSTSIHAVATLAYS